MQVQTQTQVLASRRFPQMLFYVMLLGLYLLDQGTKYWAETVLATYEPQPSITLIPGLFELHYVQNRGVAFGMMADQTLVMGVISLLLFGAGLYYASVLDWNRRETNIAGAMLFSGALGNLTDRLCYGYVIDFLHVFWGDGRVFDWPVFNVADSAICISVGYIFLRQLGLWEQRDPRDQRDAGPGLEKSLGSEPEKATISATAEASTKH